MTTDTPDSIHSQTEYCEDCDRRTDHSVAVEIRQEGDPIDEPDGFSREPYRVATCRFCANERVQRMNNA